MEKEVILEKIKLPAGVSRATHFLAITKDLSLVAIKKDAQMKQKANATRTKNAKEKFVKLQKKIDTEAEKLRRKETRAQLKQMREDIKKTYAEARKQAEEKKSSLQRQKAQLMKSLKK